MANEDEDLIEVTVNGSKRSITVDDVAELDTDGIEVNYGGFAKTPPMISLFAVKSAELTKLGGYLVAQFDLEVEKCYDVNEEGKTPEDMIGTEHRENVFIKDVNADVGKVLAILEGAGMHERGKLQVLLDSFQGYKFVGQIKWSKNKNDPENPYVNMDLKSITTQEAFEAAMAE